MIKTPVFFVIFFLSSLTFAKEIALTFDDAPKSSTRYFESKSRTEKLIRVLKDLKIPEVMIFATPRDSASNLTQLQMYKDAGHTIANHTSTHRKFDLIGFDKFSEDAQRADTQLSSLFKGQKFFRFPFLHEGPDVKSRDQMRDWLKKNNYRNGMVSIDTSDYLFSAKINEPKYQEKKIDHAKLERLFVKHVIEYANFYDNLAVKTIGYSPKHILLLHEFDATVMYLEALVKELRKQGWTIISAQEAYQDKLYLEQPQNLHANSGILTQIAFEKTGLRMEPTANIEAEIDLILENK